jgi:hypothetical protein
MNVKMPALPRYFDLTAGKRFIAQDAETLVVERTPVSGLIAGAKDR